ncbi:hypothetical protein C8Q74DRAFT_1210811, partial [Fomes fomentarius]
LINFFNDNIFSEFDRMFADAFDGRTRGGAGEVQRPSDNNAPRVLRPRYVDIHEDKDKNLLTATFELPGINKQDVSIDVRNNVLTVSGKFKFELDWNESGYVVGDFSPG